MRDHAWLRTFLRLNACAGGAIPEREIRRQEDTVLRALALLDQQPGIMLADEVGMGKTYEALGILAALMQEDPKRRALVLTPGPDLNIKWVKELAAFCDPTRQIYQGFSGQYRAATHLGELIDATRAAPIVVAPVSMFAGGRAAQDRAYLLSLWCEFHELRGNQTAAVFRAYRNGDLSKLDPRSERFFGEVDWEEIAAHVPEVMKAHEAEGVGARLKALFAERAYEAFGETDLVDRALADLRFRVTGALLPPVHLLIVDEAHKLKNAAALRAIGVRTAFARRFDKALFLTATPFQLSVEELEQVFALFSLARTATGDLGERASRLLADIKQYQTAYADFERVWQRLDEAAVADFAGLFAADPTLAEQPEDPGLRVVVEQARRLLSLKRQCIEPGMRTWMIRSLREDKRIYRHVERRRLPATDGEGVPFILYERFIAELFRTKSRTHKAAVQINMVSSYEAARTGAILSDEVRADLVPEAERYRELLRRVLGDIRDEGGGHPKLRHVVAYALEAASQRDKTLIFCSRIQTLNELRRQIHGAWMKRLVAQWQVAYPGATEETIFGQHKEDGGRGWHTRLRERFQRSQDALYLALRERYVQTLLDAVPFAQRHLPEIVRLANHVLARQRLSGIHAERLDWAILKRCVEHATALTLRAMGEAKEDQAEALLRLCDDRYVALGYDLELDDLEQHGGGERAPSWSISEDDARLVLDEAPHLWRYLTAPLLDIPPALRVRATERLARYLTFQQVEFLPQLMGAARSAGLDVVSIESRALLEFTNRYWTTPLGRPWCDLLRRFLVYACSMDSQRNRDVLDGAITAGEFVRHTVEGESRERLREAFNTPLYPMVLIANEVMQEGLDLHHHCARVVHHDLAWNPAQLEQRVGRVDRLGSLLQKRREREHPEPRSTLHVLVPLVANTIDERLERTVRLRERWLEFLLGAPPDLREHGLADDPPPELPQAFAEALRVELGPPRTEG